MKQPVDLARRFLAVADRDIKTLRLLIATSESSQAPAENTTSHTE